MQYRGRSYRISETPEPDGWLWTVRLSVRLNRTGTASSQSAAEAAVMQEVDRAIAIENETAQRKR
jgi:hypothetical protein